MAAEAKLDKHKQQTKAQWNRTPCGTGDFLSGVDEDSLAYFDEIHRSRYEVTDAWMPRVIPFALAKGKRLLEIGHGIGTDLLMFAEAGAAVYGVDLTESIIAWPSAISSSTGARSVCAWVTRHHSNSRMRRSTWCTSLGCHVTHRIPSGASLRPTGC